MAEFVATVCVDVDVLDFSEITRRFDLSDFDGEMDEVCLGDKDLTGKIKHEYTGYSNTLRRRYA